MIPKLVDCLKLVFKNKDKPDTFLPVLLLSNPHKNTVLSNEMRIPFMEWKTDIQLFDKCFFTEKEWNDLLDSHSFRERAKDWYLIGSAANNTFYPVDKLIKKLRSARSHVITDYKQKVMAKYKSYRMFIMVDQKNLNDTFKEVTEPDEISSLTFFFGKEGVPDYIFKATSEPYYVLKETGEDWYITYKPTDVAPFGVTRLMECAYQMAYEEQALDLAMKCKLLDETGYHVVEKGGIPIKDVLYELEKKFREPY